MGTLLFLQPWLRLTTFASWNCWVNSSGVLVTNVRIFTIRSAPLRLPHETPLRNDPTELVTLLSPANAFFFVCFQKKHDFWSFLGKDQLFNAQIHLPDCSSAHFKVFMPWEFDLHTAKPQLYLILRGEKPTSVFFNQKGNCTFGFMIAVCFAA